jgi:hypothetical protein
MVLGVVKLVGKRVVKSIAPAKDMTGFIETIRKINAKDVGSYQIIVVN